MNEKKVPILEVSGVTKEFPGVKALKGVSLSIMPGEVHSLCGENGAGKSTLIKVLTGAHQMDSGKYLIDGQEVAFKSTHEAINKGIACIYQELSIVPQLDVGKNMFLGNLPQKRDNRGLIDYKTLYSETQKLLDRLGLGVSPKAIAGELSVGQQQMIEIGRALTRNARVIIMDEPTSSLSERETETLLKLIDTLTKSGVAIVYISHKLDEVMQISDRITVIRDGENIITVNKSDVTKDALITHMIGRTLENLYQKKPVEKGETVLEVKSLTRKGVFKDISFSVRKGEVLGFFGLVGAGRSEIMRALFGVDSYDRGDICIDGEKVKIKNPDIAISRGMGFAPEDRKLEGLSLRLSILLNMTLVKLRDINTLGFIRKKEQVQVAEQYVDSISIKTPSTAQLVGNLSGGNQQKVVIAKWLMMHPKVLILDEPTRGIDVGSKSEIYGLISELASQGVAVLVVSSEIPEILGICDRVITISEGKKTADMKIEGVTSAEILKAALGGGVK